MNSRVKCCQPYPSLGTFLWKTRAWSQFIKFQSKPMVHLNQWFFSNLFLILKFGNLTFLSLQVCVDCAAACMNTCLKIYLPIYPSKTLAMHISSSSFLSK
jgi:hypothetical protein